MTRLEYNKLEQLYSKLKILTSNKIVDEQLASNIMSDLEFLLAREGIPVITPIAEYEFKPNK
jgi:hypothetical protein